MVVPNRSGGTGNGTAIEIQILARDQASTILTQVQSGFNNVASSAAVASAKVTAMSVAIAALAGTSLGKLAQVSQVFLGIKSALDTPVTRTVFDQIKQGAEESLKSTSSLSSVLSSVASVGGVAGQGFFGITKTSVIDDVESRFDKVSKKITGRLVDGFTNLPIEKLPLADKLLPPGVLEAAVGPLDKTLSDVIVGKVIGQKVPNALGSVFKRIAGQELGDTIAGTVRNSPLAGIASEPIKQLLGGSVLGAIESKISGTLSGAFKLGFVQADSFITAGATNLGLKVGTAILRQASGATAQNFALFDRLVGGQATKFVNNELPKLGKQAVEKSGAVQLVRTLSGELTNLISGSIVTGLTGGLAGGPAAQAITQLLGDDLAAKGIKNLTGGVLVKVGEQVADITQLTFAARAGFEALFNVAASGVAKSLTGKLTVSALGVIEGIIPPQIKQIFGVIEGLFPEQIADLREKLIDTIGSTVGGAIENFATAEVDRLQARAEELNAFLKNQGASTTPTQPVDTDFAQRLDLAEQADEARSRVADLRQEITELQNTPINLKDELVRIELDTTLAPEDKQRLITDITSQIQAAEQALESPVEVLRSRLAELESVIAQTPVPAIQGEVPQALQQELNVAIESEDATSQISELRAELEELNATPLQLKEDLAAFEADSDLSSEALAKIREDITKELANTEKAIAPRVAKINQDIARLGKIADAAPRGVNEVLGDIASARRTIPIDSDEVVAARERLVDLGTELQALQDRPEILKEELIRVQLDAEIPDDQRRELVASLTQDIQSAAEAMPDAIARIQGEMANLQGTIDTSTPIGTRTVAPTPDGDSSILVEQFEAAERARAEIAGVREELARLEAEPVALKEQLVQVTLDTEIPDDQKQELVTNLTRDIREAELALRDPITQIQAQIESLNEVIGRSPQTVDQVITQRTVSTPDVPTGTAPVSVDNFEAVDNARTELAAIEAQIDEINAKPIQLRAELERVQLDTTISDEDKAALTEGLLSQIAQAEAAIQSPLQRLARTIVGVVAGASEESGGTLIVDVQKIFGKLDDFLEGTLSEVFTEIGSNAAKGFAKGLGNSIFQEIAPILDSVDGFILGTIDKIKNIPGQFTEPLGQISNAFTAVAGVNEPLALFEGIQEKAGQAFGAIAKVGEQITFFQSGFDTLRTLVTNGPFELLIGQNIRLNEQLLSTKASLISTNKIVDGFSGDEVVATAAQKSDPNNPISDQQAQIMALDAPVNAAIERVRKGSLELSGVTSSQLIESFQIVAQNASSIGVSLEESADLTLGLAASFSTLGVPLEQARQEVTSILTAQISSDSVVAKSLGITNEQVRLYKSQGKIFEFLEGKLKGFREGNKLAAQSIAGVTSNIQEIFENIALEAGKPLLKPIVDELTKIEDFLTANQAGITAAVSDVALNLFEGIKAAFDALKVVGGALQGILTQLPIYLFESLSNFLKIAAESAITTIKALEPMISVFTQLFEVIRPLAGPLLQIAVQAKALQVGIGALGGSFGFLANLLPGVGDLLFGVSARTLPMVNLFPALAGGLGQGAAGFLLLGQNMNSIPGLAGQVAARLGAFGPLGPVIAGLIPSIAGVGITIAGLARNFPPLQAGINKIFAANPADLVSGLKAFTGFIPGLSLLNPLLDSASDRLRVVAGNQSLSAFATAQFETALRAAGVQLRNFVVSTALLGAGLFLAFQAVDKFILKNEQLIEVIKGTVEGIQNTLGVLAQFATNPFFTGISVTIGVAIIAANGLHLALLRLVATQVAGWAGAVAGGLSQLAKFLSLIRLGAMAQGAIQASVGLQGLAIAMTQGSAASAQFLAANGINVVTLGTLQASLTATVARIRLFIITTLQSAGTLAKNFVASVLAASSALFSSLLKAIPAAIAGLRATRATATGTSFSFVGLATSIKATSTAMIGGIIGAAKGVVASLVAMATGAGGGAIAFGTLATSIGTTIAGLAVLLAPIVAVVAAIASIGLLVQAKRISDSTAAVEKQGEATNTAFDSALQTAQKLKSVREDQEKRTSNGIELTKEEYAANQQLLKQAQEQQSQLDKQIVSLEKSKKDTVGDANKGNIDAQIEQLKKAKETLTSFSSDIQLAPKDLPRLGSTFEQLAEKAKSAQEAVNNSSGDPEIFKQKSQELIEITQQQLEQNQINAEEARARLDDLAGNANVDAETQIKAQQAITESYKAESQKQIDAKSAADEKIKAGIESGRVREIEGEKQLTASRIEQTNLQLEAAQKAHDERLRLLDKERAKTLKFLETELATRQKDATAKVGTKDEDSATKAVEQTQNKITALETANNQQRANLEQQFGAERDKLQAEQERNITEGAKREQEIRLKTVEKANKTATDALTKAQNDRLISTQKLVNAGVLSQEQAEEQKVKATAQSNAAQIQAETKRQSEIEALIKSAPTAKAREELELQLRESRLKSQDLTLKSLETEAQAQQAHIATVKAGLEKQGNTELLAIEKRVNAGIATEAEAGDARADQRVRSLTAEINLEKAGSAKRLALELELQSAIRAAREPESAKRKEELQNVQTAEQIALEKRINEGLASETEAADLTADQRVAQIQQELSLEGLSKTERLNLELELQRAIRGARESESAKRKAELEDEQNVELLAIEKRINTGAATEAQAGRLRASGRVAQLQAELELEGQSKSDRLKLQIELEQAIRAEQEATLAERREKLEQVNQVAQNQIEAENQKLNQQKLVYDTITQAMENRNRLIQAGANLIKAQADFQVAELNVLAQGEKSEFRKRQLTEITAAIRLRALIQQQAFDRESLAAEQERNRLAIENEKIQNRIAIGEQKANIASARADLEVARLDPKTTAPALEALQLKLQAEVDKGGFLEEQTGLIDQKGAINDRELAIKQAQQRFEQRSALRGAQSELVEALPPGQRNRARRELQQNISEDLGAENYQDLRNKGLASSRQLVNQQFGTGVTKPVDFDAEAFDMQRQLAGVRREFGAAAVTPAAGAIVPVGTQPLALPPVELAGLGATFQNSGQMFVSGIDRLVKALDGGVAGGQSINVSLTTGGVTQNRAIATTTQTQQPSIENVVGFAKQLLGI